MALRSWPWWALPVMLLAATPCRADANLAHPSASAEGSDADAVAARATAAAGKGDFEQARALYAQSYQMRPLARTLVGLALAELGCQDFVDAANHARQARDELAAEPGELAASASTVLSEAEKHVTRLEVQAPTGTAITVDGAAPRAVFRVTSSDSGSGAGALVYASAGSHEVGALGQVRHVIGRANEALTIAFAEPPPAMPPPSASDVLGSPPLETDDTRKPAPSSGRGKWATALVLGGATVALAAVGTGFTVVYVEKGVDATRAGAGLSRTACGPSSPLVPAGCSTLQDALNGQRSAGTLATAFFAASALGAATTLATVLLWPSPSPDASNGRVRVAPTAGQRAAALTLSGTW